MQYPIRNALVVSAYEHADESPWRGLQRYPDGGFLLLETLMASHNLYFNNYKFYLFVVVLRQL